VISPIDFEAMNDGTRLNANQTLNPRRESK